MVRDKVSLCCHAIPGIPLIQAGDDLASILSAALTASDLTPQEGDILVVAQKVVSKAEGRLVRLDEVTVTEEARRLAEECDKDARLVTLILAESQSVMRKRPGLIIVRHRLGFVMANAGIDQSNVATPGGDDVALLLPEDPDESCRRLRVALEARFGCRLGVIMSDSIGRAWRLGNVGHAIGIAGPAAVRDLRDREDLHGRPLAVTETGFADEIAAAAGLLMGQADESLPLVLLRGLDWDACDQGASASVRPLDTDLFP